MDIEDPILADLKKLRTWEKKSLGQLVSSLLAQALKTHDGTTTKSNGDEREWITVGMGARVDLSDKDAVNRILDAE